MRHKLQVLGVRIYHVVSSHFVPGLAPAPLAPGGRQINDVLKSKHMDGAAFCATVQRLPPVTREPPRIRRPWLLCSDFPRVSKLRSKASMESRCGIESPFSTKATTPDIVQPLKWLIPIDSCSRFYLFHTLLPSSNQVFM